MATDKAQERTEIKDCKKIIIILSSALSIPLACIVTCIVYTRCKNKGDKSESGTTAESIPLEQQGRLSSTLEVRVTVNYLPNSYISLTRNARPYTFPR
ncbi:hypothetical protein DPMN_029759 [Dreissena polymorpha]|uniref:Uncharacterized protein n=1 Tax=Dreissena polymorpha TaxID=45954 RepID=A0A9D4LZ54_DREPO|nr:hypothetical protein DPMN_029759 [Dreissena polymorpha]